ncbi:MAG: hypothetical protein Aurels2KO_11990 [Aureliella sp.]
MVGFMKFHRCPAGGFAFLIAASLSVCAVAQQVKTDPESVNFAVDIRPLLSDRCFACHGPDEEHREADLRVDQLDSMTEDRGGYSAIRLDELAESEILARITSDDPGEVMPPPEFKKPLSTDEQALVTQWVLSGAPWQQHWAYVEPVEAPLPSRKQNAALAQGNWIDAWVDAKLESRGLSRSVRADTITLARRLAFDITGLAPRTESVQRLESGGPDALARYVDELLASPTAAERLAVHWLDLVRYADTVGYHGDQDHNISPYRDYVIRSFAQNKPFDQFTIEQLAGDLLPEPTDDQIVATGYNRLLQTSHEGGVQPAEYRAIYAADRVRNVSAVWMGATVGCAQCHDHKYDPISTKDFYSLSAFFADVDDEQHFKVGSNALPTRRPPEQMFFAPHIKCQIIELEFKKAALGNKNDDDCLDDGDVSELEQEIAELDAELEQLKSTGRLSMVTKSIAPRTTRVLPRGNWLDDSGDIVVPNVPGVFGKLSMLDEANGKSRATRLDLARWLVDPDDGAGLLTARVMVNRLWMLMFGEGLSRSVEDFGGQGEPPTHPELLDMLAIQFVESGWDIKFILREIAGSATYQQSSQSNAGLDEKDPENRLLARQNRFRLPAEMVRDHALECGGLLVTQVGGASVKPYQPAGYYRHLNFPKRKYKHDADAAQWRRAIYVHWQRQFLHPMLRAFDAPTREECTARRPQSNTPLAAIVLLNDPTFVEAARGLAVKGLQHSDGHAKRTINHMFMEATSRTTQPDEAQVLLEVLDEARNYYDANAAAAGQLTSVGQLKIAPPGVSAAELAAWTTVARVILNMGQTYARN